MQSSPEVDKVAAAIVAAQAEMEAVAKEAINPTFSSKYATLDDVTNAVFKACRPHKLAVLQGTEDEDEAGVSVVTTVIHESGQWLSTRVRMPMEMQRRKDGTAELTAQKASSALTYGRRVGLAAFFAIVSEVDDDGEAASQGTPVQRSQTNSAIQPGTPSRPQGPPDRTQAAIDRVAAMGKAGPTQEAGPPKTISGRVMPGKVGVHFKDRYKRAWAGEPIEHVPGPVLAEALEWMEQKAGDPTNKYADKTREDVAILRTESQRRLGAPTGVLVKESGPGLESFDDVPDALEDTSGDLPF